MSLTSRENAWHERDATVEHFKRFENLVDFHMLTRVWLKTLEFDDQLPHQLTRVMSPGATESLELLDRLSESAATDLSEILREEYPSELLDRAEETVWAVQAWFLRAIVDRTPRNERKALTNVLEHSSWKHGRDCAKKRWPPQLTQRQFLKDIRSCFLAFQDSPLANYPKGNAFLIRRSLPRRLEIELLSCPHYARYYEVQPVADQLCSLHAAWTRGYAHTLNHMSVVEYHPKGDSLHSKCCLVWSLADNH